MVIAFIVGGLIAGFGIILSLATHNWQISFIISGTVGVISLVFTGLIKNAAIINRKRSEITKKESIKAIDDVELWATTIAIVGSPNVAIAVWLFFKLYR